MSILPLNSSPALPSGIQANSTLGQTGDIPPVLLRHGTVCGDLLVSLHEDPIAVVVIKPRRGLDRSLGLRSCSE